jgi:undecaprenyl-diphosphatase
MLADKIHLVNNYCGGKYGFVSSHAANSFAFAIITSLFLKNRIVFWILLIWASIISYSRIYLGLHFPLDVSVGALFGIFSAILFYKICNLIIRRNNKDN